MRLYHEYIRSPRFSRLWRPPPEEMAFLRRGLSNDRATLALDPDDGTLCVGELMTCPELPWRAWAPSVGVIEVMERVLAVVFFEEVPPIGDRRAEVTWDLIERIRAGDPKLNGGNARTYRQLIRREVASRERAWERYRDRARPAARNGRKAYAAFEEKRGRPTLLREEVVRGARDLDRRVDAARSSFVGGSRQRRSAA